jgi:osomolarity two-component system phosphorelay intermediate protein YPD1
VYSSERNLNELSSLGHFLKGSSATLGFTKVKDNCQIIQQYGHRLNVDGSPEPNEEVCLKKISDALAAAKDDMAELEKILRRFFNGDSDH